MYNSGNDSLATHEEAYKKGEEIKGENLEKQIKESGNMEVKKVNRTVPVPFRRRVENKGERLQRE